MSNNPLKQYFRRPAIYIKLPSEGKYYDKSVVETTEMGDIPIYPMTVLDEITSKTPDAVFNGQAVVDIIHSCVPNIKNAWEINVIDLDAILVAIKIASAGEKMGVSTVCPQCSTEAEYDIDLIQVLSNQKNVDYSVPLKIRELEIKFKPLTYLETNKNNLAQFELQKALRDLDGYEDSEEKQKIINKTMLSLNKKVAEIVAATIEFIKTPECVVYEKEYIAEFLEECDKMTNSAIRDRSVDLKSQSQLKPLHLKCQNCSTEYSQQLTLNITDFFD
jgi:hypothetical protein